LVFIVESEHLGKHFPEYHKQLSPIDPMHFCESVTDAQLKVQVVNPNCGLAKNWHCGREVQLLFILLMQLSLHCPLKSTQDELLLEQKSW